MLFRSNASTRKVRDRTLLYPSGLRSPDLPCFEVDEENAEGSVDEGETEDEAHAGEGSTADDETENGVDDADESV